MKLKKVIQTKWWQRMNQAEESDTDEVVAANESIVIYCT